MHTDTSKTLRIEALHTKYESIDRDTGGYKMRKDGDRGWVTPFVPLFVHSIACVEFIQKKIYNATQKNTVMVYRRELESKQNTCRMRDMLAFRRSRVHCAVLGSGGGGGGGLLIL